jgi:hypothetical protein
MKKFLAHHLSWALFWIGHTVHLPMLWFNWVWIYPIYNKLMDVSYNIQKNIDVKGPWK